MEGIDSKDVGLAIGQILGSQLFGFEDLHYGYWSEGLSVNIRNFSLAQERYSEFVIAHIPSEVRTILDVGAGSGKQAERLIARGYEVDCVSPSVYLGEKIRTRLGDRAALYSSKIENCALTRSYDLVLFSESFQYVNMRLALEKSLAALKSGGHLIISDFFKRAQGPEGPLGGGHLFAEFSGIINELPLKQLFDQDITEETAPTMDMFGEILNSTAKPVKELICGFIEHRHPSLFKFLAWKFKNRFSRIENKYFTGALTAQSFKAFKTYRFMVFQKLQTT